MITKKLGKITFAWEPSAFRGRGYWFVLGKNGNLGRAASKKEAISLGIPKMPKPKEEKPQKEQEKPQPTVTPKSTATPAPNKDKKQKNALISTKTFNSLTDVRSGDSFGDALGKFYALMKVRMETEKEQEEIDSLFTEEREEMEEKNHKELLAAILSLKPAKKTRQQKRAEERKEKKKEESKDKVEAKKAPEKAAEKAKAPEKAAEKPKAEKVEKEVAPKKQAEAPKKAEQIPEKPSTPAPSAQPTTPSVPTPKVSTIAKVATVAGVGAAGVFASQKAFTDTMYPYAQKASEKLGGKIPPEAILGQWAGESGGGKSVSAPFNYAGIKAGKGDKKGDYVLTEERYTDAQIKQAQASGESLEKVLSPDDKITKKGKQVTVDEWYGKGSVAKAEAEGKHWVQVRSYFAKFDDFDDFTNRYVAFLSSDRYKKAREATTPSQFGLEVAKAGYATASAEKYSAGIAGFAKDFTPGSGSGTQLASASAENKDLKSQSGGGTTIVNNNTNIVAQGGKKETLVPNKVNDKPIMLQG